MKKEHMTICITKYWKDIKMKDMFHQKILRLIIWSLWQVICIFFLFWNISFHISWPKIIITKNQLIAGRIIGHCHYAVSHWTFDIFLIEILFHCFWRFQNWPLDSQIMKSRNNIETWPENPFSWQARKLLPDDIHSFISLISLSFGPSTSRGSD